MEKYTPKNLGLFQIGPGYPTIEELNLVVFFVVFFKVLTPYECINLRIELFQNIPHLKGCNLIIHHNTAKQFPLKHQLNNIPANLLLTRILSKSYRL